MKLSFIGSTLSYLKGRFDRAHEYFVLWCIPMTVAKPCQRLLIVVFAGMVSLMQLKKKHGPSCASLCTVHSSDCDPNQDSPQCSARYCLTRNHTESVRVLEGKHA